MEFHDNCSACNWKLYYFLQLVLCSRGQIGDPNPIDFVGLISRRNIKDRKLNGLDISARKEESETGASTPCAYTPCHRSKDRIISRISYLQDTRSDPRSVIDRSLIVKVTSEREESRRGDRRERSDTASQREFTRIRRIIAASAST